MPARPSTGRPSIELYRVADTDLYQRKLLRPQVDADDVSPEALLEFRKQRAGVSADAILAGITEAFYVLDEEWRFVYVNEPAERLLDHSAAELLGRKLLTVFPATVDSKFYVVFQRVRNTGVSETVRRALRAARAHRSRSRPARSATASPSTSTTSPRKRGRGDRPAPSRRPSAVAYSYISDPGVVSLSPVSSSVFMPERTIGHPP